MRRLVALGLLAGVVVVIAACDRVVDLAPAADGHLGAIDAVRVADSEAAIDGGLGDAGGVDAGLRDAGSGDAGELDGAVTRPGE